MEVPECHLKRSGTSLRKMVARRGVKSGLPRLQIIRNKRSERKSRMKSDIEGCHSSKDISCSISMSSFSYRAENSEDDKASNEDAGYIQTINFDDNGVIERSKTYPNTGLVNLMQQLKADEVNNYPMNDPKLEQKKNTMLYQAEEELKALKLAYKEKLEDKLKKKETLEKDNSELQTSLMFSLKDLKRKEKQTTKLKLKEELQQQIDELEARLEAMEEEEVKLEKNQQHDQIQCSSFSPRPNPPADHNPSDQDTPDKEVPPNPEPQFIDSKEMSSKPSKELPIEFPVNVSNIEPSEPAEINGNDFTFSLAQEETKQKFPPPQSKPNPVPKKVRKPKRHSQEAKIPENAQNRSKKSPKPISNHKDSENSSKNQTHLINRLEKRKEKLKQDRSRLKEQNEKQAEEIKMLKEVNEMRKSKYKYLKKENLQMSTFLSASKIKHRREIKYYRENYTKERSQFWNHASAIIIFFFFIVILYWKIPQ
ncbi:unnamed protein product [Moneuplotes crassus]|uniref:Uncharacterized protein n=1 Tax=Euplotes crassus TaxID=5936 RepID=A0AAD1U8N9_EUPCR|nr:unnamed protein product [Moneuplotes crassus]